MEAIVEHSFDCLVLAIENDIAYIRLLDKAGIEPDMEAEMELTKLESVDVATLVPGSMFRWDIVPDGQGDFKNVFERVQVHYTAEDIAEAERKAEEISAFFKQGVTVSDFCSPFPGMEIPWTEEEKQRLNQAVTRIFGTKEKEKPGF